MHWKTTQHVNEVPLYEATWITLTDKMLNECYIRVHTVSFYLHKVH